MTAEYRKPGVSGSLPDIQYTKSVNQSYMRIRSPGEIPDTYDIRILMTNEIGGVLRMDRESVNGEQFCRYEVTGLKTVQELLKQKALQAEDVLRLLKNLLAALTHFEEYLLDPDCLLLDAACLYADPERMMPRAAYLPFRKVPVYGALTELVRVLMVHEEGDTDLLVVLCRLMRDLEEELPLEEIRRRLGGSAGRPETEFGEGEREASGTLPAPADETMPAGASEPFAGWREAGDLEDGWSPGIAGGREEFEWEEPPAAGMLPEKRTVRTACIAAGPAVLVYAALQMQSWFYVTAAEAAGAVLGTASAVLLLGVWKERRRNRS